jgi:chemotaxis protein MotB
VARLFTEQGVDPTRLGIMGWGEYHPNADNATEDGRNRNRRVLIVVLSEEGEPKRLENNAPGAGQLTADRQGAPAPAASVASPASAAVVANTKPATAVPTVEVVAPRLIDEVPVNQVILAKPQRSVPEDVDSGPEVTPRASLPNVAAGAITVGSAHVAAPEHGP